MRRIAALIANNRSSAGVHYHVDSAAGAVLGGALVAKLLYRVFGLNLKVLKSTQSFWVICLKQIARLSFLEGMPPSKTMPN